MASTSRLARRRVRLVAAALSLSTFAVAADPAVVPAAVHADVGVVGLKSGASGEPVRQLQDALAAAGFPVAGGADGQFGPATERAVKAFQARQGLTATGDVTGPTALALGLTSHPFPHGLAEGATGDAVRQLQQTLADRGISAPAPDGVFGSSTTDAVKAFQRRIGYFPTGAVNAATAIALGRPSNPPAATTTTPTSSSGGSAVELRVGARGDRVRELQQLLISSGVNLVGGADGVFGSLTHAALVSYQTAKGLPATGTADQATLDALRDTTGTSTPATSTIGLSLGATGELVKRVQTAMLRSGFTVRGGADGVFGTATQSALRAFQRVNGLADTGVVDERTAAVVDHVLGRSGVTGGTVTYLGLAAGATGLNVAELQRRLAAVGVNVRGGADGIFGPATSQALKDFQTSQGLPATGKVDEATVAALANPKTATERPAAGDKFAVFGERGQRVVALGHTGLGVVLVRLAGIFGSAITAAADRKSRGLPGTGTVDDATAAALGLTSGAPPSTVVPVVELDVFPTGRPCGFADTWHAARSGGRSHLGVDIIAPAGTPVYATFSGTVTKIYWDQPGSLSGNGLRLAKADGTYVFYGHLREFVPSIAVGAKFAAGDVVGYVGQTGSASTPHLHLEIHPQGGAAVNPYPAVKAIDEC